MISKHLLQICCMWERVNKYFTFHISETTCLHPTDTINDSNMEYVCVGTTYTYGTECTLSCSDNLPLVGSDLIVCERDDSSSDLSVGAWNWELGEKPYCNGKCYE